VEAVPGDEAFFEVLHLRVGHLCPGRVAAGVQDGGDGQPVLVAVAAIVFTTTS
jgi:hypothetical protein